MAATADISEIPPQTIAWDVEHTLLALWKITRAPLVEIRIPNAPQGSLRGYYVPQHFGLAARHVASIDAPAIYVNLNVARSELYDRSPSRLSTGIATTDAE